MKIKFIIILSFLFIITSCNRSLDIKDPEVLVFKWHLISTTGGNAGVDDQFPLNTIIWVFDDLNYTLDIINNNEDSTKEDFLDSGTYEYSTLTINEFDPSEIYFIKIRDPQTGKLTEVGQWTKVGDKLTINENKRSTGDNITNGFIYTFQGFTEVITE